jgi:PKD repeat protein
MFGLSHGNTDCSYGDIDFGINLRVDGVVGIWEDNVSRGTFGTFAVGDVFRVAVVGGVVQYSKNGAVLYVSGNAPAYPLSVDTALRTVGATISNAVISGTLIPVSMVIWQNCVGVGTCHGTEIGSNTLTKTANTNAWDSGASSIQSLNGAGYLEFTATQNAQWWSLIGGLTQGDPDATKSTIEYGLRAESGYLSAMEYGVGKGVNVGWYVPTDRLRVAVDWNGVIHYSKNGVGLYDDYGPGHGWPLNVDTSILNTGNSMINVLIAGAINDYPIEDVIWRHTVGVSTSDNSIAKTAPDSWFNAEPLSTRVITSGDGYVEATVSESNTYRMVGLARTLSSGNYTDINYALYPAANGYLYAMENGAFMNGNTPPTYAAGDRIRVEVSGGVARYRKNGTVFYTSTQAPTYPLFVDAAMYSQNGTLTNVVISGTLATDNAPVANAGGPYYAWPGAVLGFDGSASTDDFGIASYQWNFGDGTTPQNGAQVQHTYTTAGTYTATLTVTDLSGQTTPAQATVTIAPTLTGGNAVWTSPIGVTVATNNLTKSYATSGWDAGAATTKVIGSGDGGIEWIAQEGNTRRACGLGKSSSTDSNPSTDDIAFGIVVNEAHNVYVTESGVSHGPLGTYVGGDHFRVAVEGGVVRYRKNGYLFYTSTITPTYPLRGDASLWSPNATIQGATFGYPGDVAPTANAGPGYYTWVGTSITLDGSGSYDVDGTITSSSWDFGDGTTGIGLQRGHTYAAAGTYTATLTVTDDSGSPGIAHATVTVAPRLFVTSFLPGAGGWGINPTATGFIKVNATNTMDSGAASTKSIPSGDGYVECVANATVYDRMCGLSANTTDLSATGFDFGLWIGADSKLYIYEKGRQIAAVGPYAAGDTLRVEVGQGVVRYRRNGLLLYSSGVAPVYPLYGKIGFSSYQGTLDSIMFARPQNQRPVASPGGSYYTWPGSLITLDGSGSSDPDGSVVKYVWDFGDGTPQQMGVQVSHPYAASGAYTVSLTVTDDEGGVSAAATAPVTVAPGLFVRNFIPSNSWGISGTSTGYIKVSGTNAWDSGAISTKWIPNGDGYMECTAVQTGTDRACGLSIPSMDLTLTGLTYGVELGHDGKLYIYENGSLKATPGAYAANDRIRVGIEGGVVRYRKNGLLLYTSGLPVQYPLYAKIEIASYQGTIDNVTIARPQNYAPTAKPGAGYYTWANTSITFDGSASNDPDGTIASYSWNFGDGGTAMGMQPPYTYKAPGTYTVTLTVTDDEGQPSSATASVTVAPALTVRNVVWTQAWQASPSGNNLTKTASTDAWDAGASSLRAIGQGDGFQEFTLAETWAWRVIGFTANDVDQSATSIPIGIRAEPANVLRVVENNAVVWSGAYATGDRIRIGVEGGVIRYRKNGLLFYQSTLTPTYPMFVDTSIRTQSGTVQNAVLASVPDLAPISNPGGPYAAIAGEAISLNGSLSVDPDTNMIASYNWDFGDGTNESGPVVSHVYGTPGTYTANLTVTDIDGVTTTKSTTVTVTTLGTQQSSLWHNLVNVGLSGSTLMKVVDSGYAWDSGASSAKALAGGDGYLEFTAAEATLDKAIGFNNGDPDQSSIMPFEFLLTAQSRVQIREGWNTILMQGSYPDFGTYAPGDRFRISIHGGVVRYWQNGVLLYTSAVQPVYPLDLDTSFTVEGAAISNAVLGGTFLPNQPPVSEAGGPYAGAPGAAISFSSQGSIDPDGRIVAYSWDFGDGSALGSGMNSQHAYAAGGAYTVTLTVTDDGGLTTPAQAAVTVASGITTQDVIWTDPVYAFIDVGFVDKQTGGDNWNAGATSRKAIISGDGFMDFRTWDTFRARACGLSHTDNYGTLGGIDFALNARADGFVEVQENGVLKGTFGAYQVGDVLRVGVENGAVTYRRNGVLLFTSSAAPTYPLNATCSLYSSNANVANAHIGGQLTNVAPKANPGGPSYDVGLGQPAILDATQSTDDGSPLTYTWDFGDGTTGSGAVATHSYDRNGTYPLTLTVTDLEGLSNISTAATVTVREPLPVENVVWTNIQGASASSNTLTKTWSSGKFDSGASSTQAIMSGSGFLEFTALETDKNRACGFSQADVDTSLANLNFGIQLTLEGAVQIWEQGHQRGNFGTFAPGDHFRIVINAGHVYYWKNEQFLYRSTVDVVYPLMVDTALNTYGSTIADAFIAGRFQANQPPRANAGGPYYLPANGTVSFDGRFSTDPDGTIVSYAWQFGDGATGVGPQPTHTYSGPGPFTVTLTVTDNEGATGTAATFVLPATNIDSDGDGVPDSLDCYPFDPTRWVCQQPVPGNTTPPVITLIEPADAVLVP